VGSSYRVNWAKKGNVDETQSLKIKAKGRMLNNRSTDVGVMGNGDDNKPRGILYAMNRCVR